MTRLLFALAMMSGGCDVAMASVYADHADRADVQATTGHVNLLAFEAYPTWSAAHPNQACPRSLAELGDYLAHDMTDAWDHPLHGLCVPLRGNGPLTYEVYSDGPDGISGTEDDIVSWRSNWMR